MGVGRRLDDPQSWRCSRVDSGLAYGTEGGLAPGESLVVGDSDCQLLLCSAVSSARRSSIQPENAASERSHLTIPVGGEEGSWYRSMMIRTTPSMRDRQLIEHPGNP